MSARIDVAPAAGAQAAALTGLRVVEFGFAAAGPLVGKYLADHGAEVIHVESASAPDPFRSAYPPFKDNVPGLDRAGMFAFYNQGKLGVSLDLKHARGPELARALIAKADVVIESFTPGHMAKWGLDHERLIDERPDLVMISSCNQGQTGPHARIPGYGSQLTALAGFLHLLGEEDGTPVLLYGPYIDYIAVGHGVAAVLAALLRRQATGRGCYIDLSQYESGLQFVTPALLEHAANGTVPSRVGDRDLVAVPHGVYPCAGDDRWIAISVWDDDEWRRLGRALGSPAWACDARSATAAGRRAVEQDLETSIAEHTRTRTREDLTATLRAARVHVAPVLTISELFTDPQLASRRFWRSLPHDVIGQVVGMAPPFTLSATPARLERAGPLLGADNERVFGELLGLGREGVDRLRAEGVLT